MTASSHFLIGSAIGPKVNLHYRPLLSSVLLIPLLSLCSYTVITLTSQHIRLYLPATNSILCLWRLIIGCMGTPQYETGFERRLVGLFLSLSRVLKRIMMCLGLTKSEPSMRKTMWTYTEESRENKHKPPVVWYTVHSLKSYDVITVLCTVLHNSALCTFVRSIGIQKTIKTNQQMDWKMCPTFKQDKQLRLHCPTTAMRHRNTLSLKLCHESVHTARVSNRH